MVAVIIVVALLALVALIVILAQNSMIAARNRVEEAWSGIDVQLKRRHDLVPNLVETVKGYATHEREVFERATKARAEAMSARSPGEAGQKEGQLTSALTDLRATENFQQLSRQLTETEDEIQAARRIYNSNVQSYNTKIQVFPNSMIASARNFEAKEFFEITDAADREPVQVSFS